MPMSPDVMVTQLRALPGDLRGLVDRCAEQVRALPLTGIRKVVLTGDGDSYHGALATQMAFDTIADVACEALPALRFTEYGGGLLHRARPGETLVVGISASGRTERVVQAMARARDSGAVTVAVTGVEDSSVAAEAAHRVVVALPDLQPSPGIRTYQASLVGLLLIAIQLGDPAAAEGLREEISALADVVAAGDHDRLHAEIAAAVAESGVVVAAGSGPNHGTALFAAAKVIEAAGVPAIGQDLEEWCHVERFSYPRDMPLFVIAAPGRSRWRAVETAAKATAVGRRVVAVVRAGDHGHDEHAWRVLPVPGTAREEFSPLLYHPFACAVAATVARLLGRRPFQS